MSRPGRALQRHVGTPAGRILYLALADARGHLMRAHLLSGVLGEAGLAVDIVTTSREGVRFLASMGRSSVLLSEHFRVEFGDRHDMSRRRTDARVARYLLLPWRAMADLRRLAVLARGADLVVNDSLHPALLLAPALGFPRPVVQVYGENLWWAMEANLDDRAPAWLADRYRRALGVLRDRAFARIVHTLGSTRPEPGSPPRTVRLAPIVARPGRSRAEVRAALAIPDGVPLAAVYLNPHFKDPSIAAALEEGLGQAGFRLHGVGEGYRARPGWAGTDPHLADVVHAADLFVSGAGMGALELARSSGTPLLVLLGDQPEQARNVAELLRRVPEFALREVLVGDPELARSIAATAGALAARRPARTCAGTVNADAAWVETFLELARVARLARNGRRTLVARPRPAF